MDEEIQISLDLHPDNFKVGATPQIIAYVKRKKKNGREYIIFERSYSKVIAKKRLLKLLGK